MKSVSKTYRSGGLFSRKRIHAVKHVDVLMPNKPGVVAVVGESGSGKTTLAKMILRRETPTTGDILLHGDPIFVNGKKGITDNSLRASVQAIAQSPFDAFSSHLTVDYYLRRTVTNLLELKTKDEIDKAIDQALKQVGLDIGRVAGKYVNQFSGGELQRISIARALIPDPVLILADEPVSMVDASVRMNIINLFRQIVSQENISFLYITHDLATAFYLADELIIMQNGEIVERGKPTSVLNRPSHPYTKLLITSIPRIGEKWEELMP